MLQVRLEFNIQHHFVDNFANNFNFVVFLCSCVLHKPTVSHSLEATPSKSNIIFKNTYTISKPMNLRNSCHAYSTFELQLINKAKNPSCNSKVEYAWQLFLKLNLPSGYVT